MISSADLVQTNGCGVEDVTPQRASRSIVLANTTQELLGGCCLSRRLPIVLHGLAPFSHSALFSPSSMTRASPERVLTGSMLEFDE
jgi:hypothetical protein